MDGQELHEVAYRVAAGLPAATQGQPFGEGTDVFKVVGKVFAIVSEFRGTPIVSLKCRPPHGAALVRDHDEISPGYHLNKQHWITVAPGPGVDETLVEDLVGNSYDLVVSGLPRDRRPLDPARGEGAGSNATEALEPGAPAVVRDARGSRRAPPR